MLFRPITEGFKNLTRTGWISTTAITVLFVSVLFISILSGFRIAFEHVIRFADTRVALVVYISKNVTTTSDIELLKGKLEKIDNVKDVSFVSKEDEKRNIESSLKSTNLTSMFTSIGKNPLLDSFRVQATKSENYTTIKDKIQNSDFRSAFDSIDYREEVINNLTKIYYYSTIVLIAMVALFAFVSTIVMINILRISIHTFKDEIEIMRLVGGTNSYIQQPFIVQGLLFGLIASVLVGAIYLPTVYLYVVPEITKQISITNISEKQDIMNQFFIAFGVIFLCTLLLTGITAQISSKRYLNK
jgi:cell division transport system permease protein